jgi:AcrR family transcriptional regulator
LSVADANGGGGRPNQKRRTRKALLEAAARLMKRGEGVPTLEEVAEEALVSRATAYRYFPGVEPLLVEAALDIATPDPAAILGSDAPDDPAARVKRVDAALDAMVYANEAAIRTMLIHSLQQKLAGSAEADAPARQNRRAALIEAALHGGDFEPGARDRLAKALALVLGSESMLVFRDVLQLGDAEVRAVKDWAIDALVVAARRP